MQTLSPSALAALVLLTMTSSLAAADSSEAPDRSLGSVRAPVTETARAGDVYTAKELSRWDKGADDRVTLSVIGRGGPRSVPRRGRSRLRQGTRCACRSAWRRA